VYSCVMEISRRYGMSSLTSPIVWNPHGETISIDDGRSTIVDDSKEEGKSQTGVEGAGDEKGRGGGLREQSTKLRMGNAEPPTQNLTGSFTRLCRSEFSVPILHWCGVPHPICLTQLSPASDTVQKMDNSKAAASLVNWPEKGWLLCKGRGRWPKATTLRNG
jgi:hypothetical protein